ncbi:MAG TPA: hypothetical protein VFD39_01815, partial [Trueperaceae bacterium]|nr:hypothetical protein [Trueperaceae bacterium]
VGDLLFAADAVFGVATLERYPLPFAQDVSAQLKSFDVVAATSISDGVKRLLPGHGELSDDIEGLVARNRAAVLRAAEVVLAACDDVGLEDVLARTAAELDQTINDLARYHLNLCTVAAYLAHLRCEDRVEPVLAGGRLTWKEKAG